MIRRFVYIPLLTVAIAGFTLSLFVHIAAYLYSIETPWLQGIVAPLLCISVPLGIIFVWASVGFGISLKEITGPIHSHLGARLFEAYTVYTILVFLWPIITGSRTEDVMRGVMALIALIYGSLSIYISHAISAGKAPSSPATNTTAQSSEGR
jgi:hypothetical protein